MTRHRFLLALAATASLALPGAALADDDDDVTRILRGFVVPQFHGPVWDRDDDRRWDYRYRIRDDDDRWDDEDDDEDDRRDRWGDDDDDD